MEVSLVVNNPDVQTSLGLRDCVITSLVRTVVLQQSDSSGHADVKNSINVKGQRRRLAIRCQISDVVGL